MAENMLKKVGGVWSEVDLSSLKKEENIKKIDLDYPHTHPQEEVKCDVVEGGGGSSSMVTDHLSTITDKTDLLARANANNLEKKRTKALEMCASLRDFLPYAQKQTFNKLVSDYLIPLFSDLQQAGGVIEGKQVCLTSGEQENRLKEADAALGFRVKTGRDIEPSLLDYWTQYTGASPETLKARALLAAKGMVLESERSAAALKKLLPSLQNMVASGEPIEPDCIVRSARKLGLTPSALRDELQYHNREDEDAFLGGF